MLRLLLRTQKEYTLYEKIINVPCSVWCDDTGDKYYGKRQAGHTIGVSGFILVGVCIGFNTLPFPVIANFGVSFAIVAVVALVANVTLVPSLLAVMYPTRESFQRTMNGPSLLERLRSLVPTKMLLKLNTGFSRITVKYEADEAFVCDTEIGTDVELTKQ